MDMAFASDNRLGIPRLDPDLASGEGVPLPVWAWGSKPRAAAHGGTWHFYVDDIRFSTLLRDPAQLLATGASAACEPNVSVYDDTPLALALATVYRKRWAARYWQSFGVRVFVDLNLPERVLDCPEWRYGIPDGWPAFATRGYDARVDSLAFEWDVARSFGAALPCLLVVGGGRAVAAWCDGRPGVMHCGYGATKRAYTDVEG